jgi:hypothetical protein
MMSVWVRRLSTNNPVWNRGAFATGQALNTWSMMRKVV